MRLISYFRGPRAKDSELLHVCCCTFAAGPAGKIRGAAAGAAAKIRGAAAGAAAKIRGAAGAASGAHTIQTRYKGGGYAAFTMKLKMPGCFIN